MEQARITSQQHGTHEARGARGGAGKPATPQDGAQGADLGGFSLLLAALGGAMPEEEAPLANDLTGAAATPADGTDSAALALLQGQPPMDGPAAPALAGAAGTGVPEGASAQAVANALSPAGAGAQPWVRGVDAAGAGAQGGVGDIQLLGQGSAKAALESLVGQTALMDGAADAAVVNGTPAGAAPAPLRGAGGRFHAALAQAGVESAGLAGGSALLRGTAKDGKTTLFKDAAAQSAAPMASLAAGAVPDRRDAVAVGGMLARGQAEAQVLVAAGVDAAQGAVAAEGRTGARAAGEPGSAAGGPAAATGEASAAPSTEPFTLEGAAVAADAGQAGADESLAEQVAFWVHQKTQNAELTLDRDGQPVEVRLSLSGNEAHVVFRSDQAHTREMLDSSVAQLRDLLQREGLQLSSVTVGTSGEHGGRQGDGGGDGGARQGARTAAVQAGVPAGSAGGARQAANRAVDIFV